jgi:anti-sigma regulatory factor (Ser/Thr protein kinase)
MDIVATQAGDMMTGDSMLSNRDAYTDCFSLVVTEASQVAEARRVVTRLATELGFQATETGKVALVVTEAANNLVKHAVDGQLLVRQLQGTQEKGIELLALDRGPGMRDVSTCLRDGYSTTGSSGTGLGAITRLASFWDIYSMVGQGTVLLIRLTSASPSQTGPLPAVPSQVRRFEVGGICLPISGEQVSGDGWGVEQQSSRCLIMVSDGLGHGQLAAEASWEAQRILHDHCSYGPAEILEAIHASLQKTRGAAVTIAEIDADRQHVVFAGVGNITARIIMAEKTQHLVSSSGIVGHRIRKIQTFTYPWLADALLVMHSDGLLSRWDLDAYPGLKVRHPSLIAGVLFHHFVRGRDDVTVVVAKAVSTA